MSNPDPQRDADQWSPPTSSAERWRRKFGVITGLGTTDQDRKYFGQEYCDKTKQELMTTSPIIIFMLKHLALSGCAVPQQNIVCKPCDMTHAGGFQPDPGAIQMCSGNFLSKNHMEATMAHELIHLYDHCRFKVDWMNLRHHACSEIRANSLSGDCRFKRELARGVIGFSKNHQDCVRRRAVVSVAANPACPNPETAGKVVNEVFESCFKDTRPFDEIY